MFNNLLTLTDLDGMSYYKTLQVMPKLLLHPCFGIVEAEPPGNWRICRVFSHRGEGQQSPHLSRESGEQIPPQDQQPLPDVNYVTIKHLQKLLGEFPGRFGGIWGLTSGRASPVLSTLLSTRWQKKKKKNKEWRVPVNSLAGRGSPHQHTIGKACFHIHVDLRKRTGLEEWQVQMER